ncbi:MAG: hypothetical protein KTR32_27960 [Granulosicoccus sp.]|nr:hypothetical protein [Granulosicoccus sp.]
MNLPKNVTLGLFTWDSSTFNEAGNSELDIEISKWGESTEAQFISYAVQPIGVDPVYAERMKRVAVFEPALLNGQSTHEIDWSPQRVILRSYQGQDKSEDHLIAEWQFTDQNPPRKKTENIVQSLPFVIPAPGKNTHARINFWVQSGQSAGPIGGQSQEVVISKFEYVAH